MRKSPVAIESMESRELLSAAPAAAAPSAVVAFLAPVVQGRTIQATAGTPLTNVTLGFYATPVLDPPLGYRATINWGDGSTSAATLSYGESNGKFGIYIRGSHTYTAAGTKNAVVTLVTAPINSMLKFPTTVIEYIDDKVVVAPFPLNSSGGVTLHETAGKSFTAALGTTGIIAPGTDLTAIINWGDGTTGVAVLNGVGIIGIDVIKMQATGGHKYATPGKYAITVTISRSLGGMSFTMGTIQSTAIVG